MGDEQVAATILIVRDRRARLVVLVVEARGIAKGLTLLESHNKHFSIKNWSVELTAARCNDSTNLVRTFFLSLLFRVSALRCGVAFSDALKFEDPLRL